MRKSRHRREEAAEESWFGCPQEIPPDFIKANGKETKRRNQVRISVGDKSGWDFLCSLPGLRTEG